MLSALPSILTLAEKRMTYLLSHPEYTWYRGSSTFIDGMKEEIQEVEDEMRENNHIYLEDELGDIFWDYVCLIENLDQKGKISKSRVFDRCYQKFSERLLPDGSDNGKWKEIKEQQKEKLKKEHDLHYN